jgi:hypothetical protein
MVQLDQLLTSIGKSWIFGCLRQLQCANSFSKFAEEEFRVCPGQHTPPIIESAQGFDFIT